MSNQIRLAIISATASLLIVLSIQNIQADNSTPKDKLDPILKTRTGEYRFSIENIVMPNPGEKMGLLGFNYLLNFSSLFYGGIAGYGAMTGERGGFLTGGFEGGLHYQFLDRIAVETGLFLGGGGGNASTGQGGGLMLRPHFGLIYDLGRYRLGILVSKVKFPNGDINSDQIGLSIDIPFTALFSDRRESEGVIYNLNDLYSQSPQDLKTHIGFATEDILLSYQSYLLQNNSYDTAGMKLSETMNLTGVELRHYFINKSYFSLQTAGATGGKRDGYAEIFFGGGYYHSIEGLNRFTLTGSVSAGSGGGGGLDSGGGAVVKINGGIEYRIDRQFKAELETGYIKATGGRFNAPFLGLKIGFEMDSALYRYDAAPLPLDEIVKFTGWRVRASRQTYINPQRKAQINNSENIDLIGLKADRVLSDSVYISGQAYSAYSGNAGGYSAGLIGAGWQSPPIFGTKNKFNAEILIGAGGGGGLSTGGGAIVQPMIGFNHRFTQNFSAEVMGGRVKSISGDLNSTIIDFSLVYHFAGLEISR
jgi:hypothetical protein